jgi:hypothetical protein
MPENCEFKWNEQRFYGKLHFRDAHSRVAMIAAEVGTGRIVIPSKQTRLEEVHRVEGHNAVETFFQTSERQLRAACFISASPYRIWEARLMKCRFWLNFSHLTESTGATHQKAQVAVRH